MRLRVRTAREKERERRRPDLFDIMTEIAIAKYASVYGTKQGAQRDEDDEQKESRQKSRTHR
jgi:hypothetical protein